MNFSLIVAVAENNVIGDSKTNAMPWKQRGDLINFKNITTNGIVVMGKNTAMSLPEKKPLKDRDNIIVSRSIDLKTVDFDFFIVKSFNDALLLADTKLFAGEEGREIFVIGGSQMYEAALKHEGLCKIYMTKIHTKPLGDVLFHGIDFTKWHITDLKECKADDRNQYDYDFLVLNKKPV